jgi:hypothetical protein
VYSLALQADGRVLIGGGFDSVGGSPHYGVARLNGDGTVDESFSTLAIAGTVSALMAHTDGRLLVGGSYSTIGGQTRSSLARLSLPEAAVQSLDVQGSTVTWHRSGPAPEFVLPPVVYFSFLGSEGSFVPLGRMTRVAGGWQFLGAPAPVDKFYYLRASGRTSSGLHNGSQGLVESVRRAWRDDRIFVDRFDG